MAGLVPRRRPKSGSAPAPTEPAATPLAPIARAPTVAHHWLTVLVARPGPHEPVPAAGARVVVRPFPLGETRPGEPVARGTTALDGTVSLSLPAGRYAIAAAHEGDGKAVTVTLEHAGRAVLVLEAVGRRVVLCIEATRADGRNLPEASVEARSLPSGAVAARGVTDERGVVSLLVPPGSYEIRVGTSAPTRTFVEADTTLRVTAEAAVEPATAAAVNAYQSRVRQATTYSARFDPEGVRDAFLN